MYYIMNNDDEILDTMTKCPSQESLDKLAKFFGCDVWVMRGENAGMSATFNPEAKGESK